jgi:hypothetical protein
VAVVVGDAVQIESHQLDARHETRVQRGSEVVEGRFDDPKVVPESDA